MKAVILAGGLGTRLRPLTNKKPKPMLPLDKKPLLEHLIKWIKKNGIKDIVLCVSYLHETIEKYFEDGSKFGVKIEYAVSKKPLATAGQLKTAQKFIDDTFVCVYGDSIFDFNLKNMISEHKKKKSFVTMGLYEYKTHLKYGVIDTKNNGKVSAWNEKPEIKVKINMGCYVMEPKILNFIPKNKPYGMDNVIKKVISKRKTINSILVKNGFIDVGDKKTYEKLNLEYKKRGKIWFNMSEIKIREIEEGDLENGFLETLDFLRNTSELDKNKANEILKKIKQNPNHIIYVAIDNKKIVGSTTLLIEQKFIHDGGLVGHIEDVVVRKDYEGKGIGIKLVMSMLERAKEKNCYKTILDCKDDVKQFYERIGFKCESNGMRYDHN